MKYTVITGTSSDIGYATALAFVERGGKSYPGSPQRRKVRIIKRRNNENKSNYKCCSKNS